MKVKVEFSSDEERSSILAKAKDFINGDTVEKLEEFLTNKAIVSLRSETIRVERDNLKDFKRNFVQARKEGENIAKTRRDAVTELRQRQRNLRTEVKEVFKAS